MYITFANYVQYFFIILLSRLTSYAEEIVKDHQYEFQCNRSAIDHFFIRYNPEEKMEYNEAVY
jgi:hypothetical protein